MTPPRALRDLVIAERARYHRGEITLDVLYSVVDRYIAAVTAHVKAEGSPVMRRRFRPPSRAYVLRAL